MLWRIYLSYIEYLIYCMYLDRQAWANSVDPDETPQKAASCMKDDKKRIASGVCAAFLLYMLVMSAVTSAMPDTCPEHTRLSTSTLVLPFHAWDTTQTCQIYVSTFGYLPVCFTVKATHTPKAHPQLTLKSLTLVWLERTRSICQRFLMSPSMLGLCHFFQNAQHSSGSYANVWHPCYLELGRKSICMFLNEATFWLFWFCAVHI